MKVNTNHINSNTFTSDMYADSKNYINNYGNDIQNINDEIKSNVEDYDNASINKKININNTNKKKSIDDIIIHDKYIYDYNKDYAYYKTKENLNKLNEKKYDEENIKHIINKINKKRKKEKEEKRKKEKEEKRKKEKEEKRKKEKEEKRKKEKEEKRKKEKEEKRRKEEEYKQNIEYLIKFIVILFLSLFIIIILIIIAVLIILYKNPDQQCPGINSSKKPDEIINDDISDVKTFKPKIQQKQYLSSAYNFDI